MARVGGRNAAFAWIVGVVSAAVVAGLLVAAAPMLPALSGWFVGVMGGTEGDAGPSASTPPPDASGPLTRCRDLYDSALQADLNRTPGSELTQSQDAPETSATAVVEALRPQVSMTCRWTSDEGDLSTTVAAVPTDAGAIAAAALPGAGFSCETAGGRTLCSRTEGELLETIESGRGIWVSTWQRGWQPTRYADEVADAVFTAAG